ncbi:ImmA/IrrE family metallo-endopeptidase [Staphylococcus epidermidis]|nr:ImmA/IrrE family metallo-endopeptidase [Staphylococcus epidermidis]MCG1336991.1 ImmA/IrrE family metallo-endopeptidase [Staphylococcus epidermidis]MCG1392699.1 ImmA/IrrE family metallo-endopeptidase [Staphylococcus epidermidis]MCG1468931.1 ImmA/IrrE family metallo-endopeptidase [Staphylococcus epidermidis]MCG1507253.1 ImmA/IrrE family metallo-endopeptidase [Staphylococcus epidermidis]
MGKYEDLMIKYDHLPITETKYMPDFMSGLYLDGEILINDNRSVRQKLEILAEEIAHHEITYGNILNINDFQNNKYESKARKLAFEMLIDLDDLVKAHSEGVKNIYELSEFFEVTEQFIKDCLKHYKTKHGNKVKNDNYLITFEPLNVKEI